MKLIAENNGKQAKEGISRLTANNIFYEVMTRPRSGLLMEGYDGQKCLNLPGVSTFRIDDSGWIL